ncbi:hypothetical protein V7128_07225 [Neobacillus vireti]|uniref:hypothetical protein n=1 Tax=Neobacillus vireti TaxID=220686 RepID=UPI003000831E
MKYIPFHPDYFKNMLDAIDACNRRQKESSNGEKWNVIEFTDEEEFFNFYRLLDEHKRGHKIPLTTGKRIHP